MSTEKILILSSLAFFGAYFLTPWSKKVSEKIGAMDIPNHRKIHKGAVASGGGMAIFLGFLIAFLFINRVSPEITAFIIGAFIIVILGIADDILGLSAAPKFIIQSLAAFIAIYFGIRIDFSTLLHGRLVAYSFLSIPVTYLWIIGITNAINIIDGLDGLAAGITTIASFTLASVAFLNGQVTVAVLALMLGFASLGFLPHNFRSRIFMGDTGSMFLGFSLATLSVMGSVKLAAAFALFVPAIILAVPIFDTAFAIIRRIITRKPIYEGDRKHIHHRLLELGFSPLQTVIFLYIASIFFSGMAIFSTMVPARVSYLIFATSITVAVVAGITLVYFHQKKMGENGK
jgi:UDP-GlcNAc:undecaprenyl-phosphate GlcNAc-1-phosphate transferase